jgi:hypothetical protein
MRVQSSPQATAQEEDGRTRGLPALPGTVDDIYAGLVSHYGLEILSREECLELLSTQTLGRVGVRVGDTQAILPVNFALLDGDIVFRTDPGMKLMAAVLRTKVVFEADHTEPQQHGGWSVNVVGHIEEARGQAERGEILGLGLTPWAEGVRDNFVRIHSEQVTGRRIVHHD